MTIEIEVMVRIDLAQAAQNLDEHQLFALMNGLALIFANAQKTEP